MSPFVKQQPSEIPMMNVFKCQTNSALWQTEAICNDVNYSNNLIAEKKTIAGCNVISILLKV